MAPHTMAEQILSARSDDDTVSPGDHVIAEPDWILSHDLSAYPGKERMNELGHESVANPEDVIVVFDHHVPPSEPSIKDRMNELETWVENQGIEHFYPSGDGISHNIMAENGYSLPGSLILGADSHTTTHGAFGAYASGIGHTDLGKLLGTGELWLRVPATRKVVARNTLPDGCSAKDLALSVMGELTAETAISEAIEFHGEGFRDLSMAGRQTVSNIAVELGAAAGMFPPDQTTENYLDGRALEEYTPITPDEDADYVDEHVIDAASIEPLVAAPSRVDNVTPVSSVEGISVDQVFVGTCNNARYDDMERFTSLLEGEVIADGLDLIVVPGSKQVLTRMNEEGLANVILDAGGTIGTPGCGPCFGAHGGVLGEGDTCLGTMNRNFAGRMGPGEIYLGSPETAAATAMYGEITNPLEVSP